MNKSIRLVVCAGLLAGTAAAHAASYAFHYTMLDQTLITGTFDGTANGNLVENISKLAIAVNGSAMPNSGNLYSYSADAGMVAGGARVSFDGLSTSLVAFDQPVTGGNFTASFVIGAFNGGDTDAINYNIPGLAFNGEGNGDYSASRWNLSAVSAVPEPATYAMLLGGLALVGALARRRNPAQ